MKTRLFSAILLLTFAAAFTTISAQKSSKYFTDKNNVAVKGYDLVAYFTNYQAEPGSKKYMVKYDNAKFYFANKKHQQMFKNNPQKYLPQFGGYCAFAMSTKGAKVPTNPKTFKIVDGKLYLFFNDFYKGKKFNTIIPWNKNEAQLRKQAQINYAKLCK